MSSCKIFALKRCNEGAVAQAGRLEGERTAAMFANFGEDQQRRERLARQNKEHLDALRSQLEHDRERKRDRTGVAPPPQRFLPAQDPSQLSGPPMIKAPPAGAPYYAARELAPGAAPAAAASGQRWGLEQRRRGGLPAMQDGPQGRPAPPAPAPSYQAFENPPPEAPAPAFQEFGYPPAQQAQERAYQQQEAERAAAADNYRAQQYARQQELQRQQEAEEQERQMAYIRKQDALAAQQLAQQPSPPRPAQLPPQQLAPRVANQLPPAFTAHRSVDSTFDDPGGYASPADADSPPPPPRARGGEVAGGGGAVLSDRIAQLERVAEASARENRSLREQCVALQVWPLQEIRSLQSFLALVHHPSIAPPPPANPTLLHHYCTTIAQCTPPHRPTLFMSYTIQYWQWQYRVNTICRCLSRRAFGWRTRSSTRRSASAQSSRCRCTPTR